MTKTPNGRLAALSLEIASASIFVGTARRYTSFDLSVGAAGFSLDPLHAKFALSIDDDAGKDAGGPTETVKTDDAAGTGEAQAQQQAAESSGTPQADAKTDTGMVGDPSDGQAQQQADSANAGGNIDGNDTGEAKVVGDPPKDEQQ